MFEHIFSLFPVKPELSLDPAGFDSWTDQGAFRPPNCCSGSPPPSQWLHYDTFKSPWLYVQKSTPSPHVAYTDIGDLRFVAANGFSCPLPADHPAIILNTLANKVKVTLEDTSNSLHPTTLWKSTYSLKNSAPGGNGSRITSTQRPLSGDDPDTPFLPFCFRSVRDVDENTKYTLTVESVEDPRDVSIKPFKDVMILRPRPLCDTPVTTFLG